MTNDIRTVTRTDHAAVEQFIERLAELDVDEWLSVAKACGGRVDAAGPLQAIIAHHGLAMEAWNVADNVETAVHCSLGPRGFASSREGGALRLARHAATAAALALMLRAFLAADDFDRLYRPFATLATVRPQSGARSPDTPAVPVALVAAARPAWPRLARGEGGGLRSRTSRRGSR